MTTFTLDTDNNITAHDATPAAQDNVVAFATEKELTKLSADWPITRFVEVWNAFAGAPPFGDLKPVKKFTDRKTAVTRIWKAIQSTDAQHPARHEALPPSRRRRGQGGQGTPPPRTRRPRRATAARRPSSSTCSSARTAPRSPTSCPLPTGRPIASAASSPAAWARRWASPSNPSNAPMATAPTNGAVARPHPHRRRPQSPAAFLFLISSAIAASLS